MKGNEDEQEEKVKLYINSDEIEWCFLSIINFPKKT